MPHQQRVMRARVTAAQRIEDGCRRAEVWTSENDSTWFQTTDFLWAEQTGFPLFSLGMRAKRRKSANSLDKFEVRIKI